MVYFMENPIMQMDDLGGKNPPLFLVQHPHNWGIGMFIPQHKP